MADANFTGFSPTLGEGNATVPTEVGSVTTQGVTSADYFYAQAYRRGGARALKALTQALNGALPGATAYAGRGQVQAVNSTFTVGEFGGLRPVEVKEVINRPTTDADVSDLLAILRRVRPPIATMRSYGENNEATDGFRVKQPYDALLGTSFVSSTSEMVDGP